MRPYDCLLILTLPRLPTYDCSHRQEMRRLRACRLRLSRRLATPGLGVPNQFSKLHLQSIKVTPPKTKQKKTKQVLASAWVISVS